MSLINQMLRDLDSRQEEPRRPGDVRTVAARRRRRGWGLAAMALLAMMAGGVWWLQPLPFAAPEEQASLNGQTRQSESGPDSRLREVMVVQTREGSRLRLDFDGDSGYRRLAAADNELQLTLRAALPEPVLSLAPPGIRSMEALEDEADPERRRLHLSLDAAWQAGPLYQEQAPDGGDRLVLVLTPSPEAMTAAAPDSDSDRAPESDAGPATADEADDEAEAAAEPTPAEAPEERSTVASTEDDEASSNREPDSERMAEASESSGPESDMVRERREPDARERARERFAAANSALDAGDRSRAESLLRETLALQPAHVAARDTLAELLNQSGRLQQADLLLAEALSIETLAADDLGYLARQRARLWMDRGDPHQAIAALEAVYPAIDDASRSGALLAGLLYQAGRYRAAVGQYESLLRRDPGEGAWWMGLGLAREGLSDPEGAIEAYENALSGEGLGPAVRDYLNDRIVELESGR